MTRETNQTGTVKPGDVLNVRIEKLLHGGDGLARCSGRACFVPDVIPGEHITARVTSVKSQYIVANPVEIHKPSSHRVTPACELHDCCGGCQWQHIAYEHQLHWKSAIVGECFQRIGKIHDCSVAAALPSPPFHYRFRTQLKVCFAEELQMGFYKKGSHDIVDVSVCPLLAPALNQALPAIRKRLAEDASLRGRVTEVELLYVQQARKTLIACNNTERSKLIYDEQDQSFSTYTQPLVEKIRGLFFQRDAESFYQVNHEQNSRLIELVEELFAPESPGAILDLFCGCGNFSLFLARHGAALIAIDSNKPAIHEARANAALNNITHCRFIADSSETISTHLPGSTKNRMLLNPPRSGCTDRTIKAMLAFAPAQLVYISCNPATLARDVRKLVSGGYRLDSVRPVDMFPQTYHVETIVKMIRRH
ncbi:class I SAM-dependent RNA methyltransferase [Thermodesulfobacteriota bacterium]